MKESSGLLLALSDTMEPRSFQPWLPGLLSVQSNILKVSSVNAKYWPVLLLSEKISLLPRKLKRKLFNPSSTVSKKMKHYNGTSITTPCKNQKEHWTVTEAKIRDPFLFVTGRLLLIFQVTGRCKINELNAATEDKQCIAFICTVLSP